MDEWQSARETMVETQIARRGIGDPLVLEAMRRVPRERFVNAGHLEAAYADSPLPIGGNQTISQPYIVALMAEAVALAPSDRVLEIGTGSGYSAAVLAELSADVYSVERDEALAESARRRLDETGYYGRVEISVGDGTLGWPERAPFDAIVVTAGGPEVPPSLRGQLVPGGRLVIPVGANLHSQTLVRITRDRRGGFSEDSLGEVRFVPLVGAEGWAPSADRRD